MVEYQYSKFVRSKKLTETEQNLVKTVNLQRTKDKFNLEIERQKNFFH